MDTCITEPDEVKENPSWTYRHLEPSLLARWQAGLCYAELAAQAGATSQLVQWEISDLRHSRHRLQVGRRDAAHAARARIKKGGAGDSE